MINLRRQYRRRLVARTAARKRPTLLRERLRLAATPKAKAA